MNRTKTIYFLSAIVLIIGCYALNLSYSLFVQTENRDVVNLGVPELIVSLSAIDNDATTYSSSQSDTLTSMAIVEAGKEYLIKQTITNTSTVPINYSLSTDQPNNVSIATHESLENNLPYGISTSNTSIDANASIDIYLIVSNKDGEDDIVINFTLDYSYSTITTSIENSNITNEKEVSISTEPSLPYSDNTNTLAYHIINNYVNSDSYTPDTTNNENNNIVVNELFDNNVTKLSVPISTGEFKASSLIGASGKEEVTGIADYKVTGDATSGELGLFQTEDDYGTSYYFRGASSVNYVNFASFTWRIVRINGDGSVRLILDGSLDKVSKDGVKVKTNTNLQAIDSDGRVVFKTSPYDDNAYVGYMYGEFDTNSTSYDEAHQNKNNSTIKTYVDEFYKEYLSLYQDDYIADTLFCGDKILASASVGFSNKATGYGKDVTYYSATERLYYSTGTTSITTAKPTLECASSKNATDTLTEEQRVYSRYTSSIDSNTTTSKGVLVNNDLTYPIGLLSADELVMAGAFTSKNNTSYYLYDAYKNGLSYNYWWTMSPYYFTGSTASEFSSSTTSYSLNDGLVSYAYGVRPVINLKAGILLDDGVGTYGSPYTVKVG